MNLRKNEKLNGGAAYPRVIRDDFRGAPIKKSDSESSGALLGFLVASAINTLVIDGALHILRSAGVTDVSLSLWQTLGLSSLLMVWRGIERAMRQ
jgi:hypothetical protein